MKLLQTLQQRLGWRLFISYLIVIVVGVLVLAGTAEFHAPTALAPHIARMEALLGDNPSLVADLDEISDQLYVVDTSGWDSPWEEEVEAVEEIEEMDLLTNNDFWKG